MRTVKITFQVDKGREWITYGQIPDGDEVSLILTADKEGSYFPSISEYRPASERIRAWWKRLRKALEAYEERDFTTGLKKGSGRASDTATGLPIIYD